MNLFIRPIFDFLYFPLSNICFLVHWFLLLILLFIFSITFLAFICRVFFIFLVLLGRILSNCSTFAASHKCQYVLFQLSFNWKYIVYLIVISSLTRVSLYRFLVYLHQAENIPCMKSVLRNSFWPALWPECGQTEPLFHLCFKRK